MKSFWRGRVISFRLPSFDFLSLQTTLQLQNCQGLSDYNKKQRAIIQTTLKLFIREFHWEQIKSLNFISELFEVGPRPAAMAMGSIASWVCNFIVAMLFTTLQSAWGAFVFLPFTVTCVLLTILLKIYLPETRGRHISSIVPVVSNGFRSKPLMPWT